MSKVLIVAFATSLLLVGGGCASTSKTADTGKNNTAIGPSNVGPDAAAPVVVPADNASAPATAPRSAVIAIKAVGNWPQAGTATLTDMPGNNTKIDIALAGKSNDKSLPTAIYVGTCATQNAQVQYALSPVVNGRSTTTLNVNIGALLDKSPQAIKIKRDQTDATLPYAACGELK